MEYDYSVSWNEVKKVVDELIDDHDKKMAMGDIEFFVDEACGSGYRGYSRGGDTMQNLQHMMDDAQTEQEREAIRRVMDMM